MKKRLLSLALCLTLCLGLLPVGVLAEEGGGFYVPPGSHTEGGGGTYTPPEDTRAEIWCVSKPDSIGRSYDGTTDGSTIPIDLTFTDGTNNIILKEGTGFTAKKTFDSADAGWHTVTVELKLIGEAATKYKLKEDSEQFTIGGYINKAYPHLAVSLSKTTCAVGEKLLPLLSVDGAPEDAEVTYYYLSSEYKNWAGASDVEGSEAMPKIGENTAISGTGTYYVYAKTTGTNNYEEQRSTTVELTVAEKVDPVASVTTADGTETTYGSFSDAWTAAIANNGSTLKLLADATLPNGNTDLGQSLTLDLNGYVLGSSGSLTVKSGAALTVRNAGAKNSEKPVQVGLYLNLLVEKGGSFTCTDGGLRYLGLLSAGTGDYAIQLTEGESHCTFGGFAQGDANATVGDLLKATPGMALYGDYNGSDVRIERSTRINSGFTYLSFYVGPCSEHQMDAKNGTCIYCGASYVASVTASGGVTTNYTSLDDALDAMKDGDTVTLLSDAAVTRWHSLSTAFTLELNGKTTQSKAELYLHARVIVQDSSTGKTGGMAGTALLNVQEGGDLIIQSGTFDGQITINDGKLTIKGGTFNQEVDLRGGDSDSVFFSGGTFTKLFYPKSGGSFLDLLADGYAFFYTKDSNLVNAAEISGTFLYNVQVQQHTHSFTDGACACGYTCPHTLVDANGACEVCKKQFAASVTAGEDVTYYDTFGSALFYATRNDGCTLKLLADVTDSVSINTPFIFDLNGHNFNMLSVGARAKIRDSSTTKGTIKELKVFNMTDADDNETVLTVADLLEEGYAFKSSSGNKWYFGVENAITNVTVQPAPIKSVTAEHPTVTVEYGKTSGVTLTATAVLATEGGTVSYQWYKIGGTDFPIQDATENTYQLPVDLGAGTHTYRLTATSDGYPKSVDITVKVTPISLEGAEVTVKDLTYNGERQFPTVTVKLDENTTLTKNTDFDVNATMQTNAGSYTLTITGQGNYTGTKTIGWKILPKTIENPTIEVSSVTYNGQAQTPSVTVKDGATIIPDTQYTVSYQNNTNAGAATVTVVSTSNSNYKFGPTEQAFTITKADAPTVTPGKLTVVNNHKGTYTYDLKQLLPTAPNGTYGNINWNGGYRGSFIISGSNYVANHTIDDDGILTINTLNIESTTTGQVGTITITVITDNYENISLPIEVFAENKILPDLDGTVSLSKTAITFGELLDNITISGTMKDGNNTVEGTFSWPTPKELYPAGTHEVEWMFTPTNSGKYAVATGKVTITVNKATPTGKPEYTAITTSGKKLSDASLTQTETSFSVPGTVAWKLPADTEVTANTAYEWVFTPNDTDNYNTLTGTITLWHKSSSGSSSGSVTPGTKTDTVKNPDGSTTKTETKADGSKTETTTASSGGGSTGTTVTKTDAKGNTTTEASAKLSDQDVKEAQEKGEAVIVPVKEIQAAKDANAATKIKIDVPNNANKTTVEIPVENVTSGTVAVIVHEDGTEELVKDSKPTEHGVQLELSGSTTVKIIDNSKTFDDTKGHWSQDDVNFVAARELFNGVGGNQFGVSQPMTRGMVNTVLARLADVDTTPGQGQAWYEVGTDWAKKNGISDGTNPTAPVTREQLATLLYRYAGSPSVSGTLHAADAASVSDYAEDALLWANQNGIVNGVGSNTIAPKDNAQRAQVAAMLARYLQNQ